MLGAERRVKGVQAIADEIEVRFPNQSKTADDRIAQRAIDILKWNSIVSNLSIEVVVRSGWITLSGRVNWYFEKRAAEDCVRKLSGLRGITNSIIVALVCEPELLQTHGSPQAKLRSLRRHAPLSSRTEAVRMK